MQYDPRNIKRSTNQAFSRPDSKVHNYQPRLLVGHSQQTRASSSDTFGRRAWSARTSSSVASGEGAVGANGAKRGNGQGMDGVLAMRRGTDGGMEMSFVPQHKGSNRGDRSTNGNGMGSDDDLDPKGGRPIRSKVERFGAGMERGQEDSEADRRGGRTKRRDISRSASKNTFRRK